MNIILFFFIIFKIKCSIVTDVMNSLFPLTGTFLAGLSVLCGSKMRLKDNTKSKVVLVNCWVAFLQLFTTIFFLLGWIWSIVWGTLFLSYSGIQCNIHWFPVSVIDRNYSFILEMSYRRALRKLIFCLIDEHSAS